jgi:UDP-N-acetylmuramoylalanine--D-glutamate ligase
MIETLKNLLLGNPTVLILGFGREGQSTYRLLRKYFPGYLLSIADKITSIAELLLIKHDTNIRLFLGENYLDAVTKHQLVFKSPGVLLGGRKFMKETAITSQSDIFLSQFAKQTIGVTGTKGKSTTVSLINHFLNNNGKQAVLLGNIGIPPFDKIDEITQETIVVFEMSAHQLEMIHHSPHIAVLLNLFPEHLDHFTSLEKYYYAKINIGKFQNNNDSLIVEEPVLNKIQKPKAKLLVYGKSGQSDVTIEENIILFHNNNFRISIEEAKIRLTGKHNLNNLVAAMLAVNEVGLSFSDSFKSLSSFNSLPHRLEFVGNFGGIDFYNDSISTIPESAIAAIESLQDVDTVILGGFDRGIDYKKLIDFVVKNKIPNLIFLGIAGDQMIKFLPANYIENFGVFKVADLHEAFQVIKKNTRKGAKCLLSPAAASYDQFHNFEHRGDVFRELAKKISI